MYLVPLSLTLLTLCRISWLEYVVLRVCFSSITTVCNQFSSKCPSAPQLKSIIHFLLVNSLIEWQIPSNKILLWPVEWKMTHVIKDSFRFVSFRPIPVGLSKLPNIIIVTELQQCAHSFGWHFVNQFAKWSIVWPKIFFFSSRKNFIVY